MAALFEKERGGAKDQVLGMDPQNGVVAGEFDVPAAPVEAQPVMKADRMQDGFQFVKTVGTLSQDVEDKIDLAE